MRGRGWDGAGHLREAQDVTEAHRLQVGRDHFYGPAVDDDAGPDHLPAVDRPALEVDDALVQHGDVIAYKDAHQGPHAFCPFDDEVVVRAQHRHKHAVVSAHLLQTHHVRPLLENDL